MTGSAPRTEAVESFLREVTALCKKHGFSIAHEDQHGGFEVWKLSSDEELGWFAEASDKTDEGVKLYEAWLKQSFGKWPL